VTLPNIGLQRTARLRLAAAELGSFAGRSRLGDSVAAVWILLVFALSAHVAVAEERPSSKPCREHPALAAPCFTVRGRMRVYNGTPSFRIWPIGSHRLLLVSEGRFRLEGYESLPKSIADKVSTSTDLYATFQVCPFTPQEPGVAQLICVDSAETMSVRKHE
jgi:hypothetical protein